MIRVDYTKTKTVRTESYEEPFLIPEYKREVVLDLPDELWKQIPGVPSCNYASNMGRFKTIDTDGNTRYNTITESKNSNNRVYRDVSIENPSGKNFKARASRILAKTFIDESFPLFKQETEVVDHIDNDSTNDKITNLQITTQSKNIKYALSRDEKSFGYKFTKVRCVETGEVFESTHKAAEVYGVKFWGYS